jgi:hypothetical protein
MGTKQYNGIYKSTQNSINIPTLSNLMNRYKIKVWTRINTLSNLNKTLPYKDIINHDFVVLPRVVL